MSSRAAAADDPHVMLTDSILIGLALAQPPYDDLRGTT
jgi:hypothetical protein